ncbi:MAG: hypothetical protein HYV42_01065 [Candidatus Magasanikbacteria bacterium]|nr:hypothetical protein [Candidatus Magasanikbacteria bacterium]
MYFSFKQLMGAFFIGLLVAAASGAVSFLFPKQYRAESEVLIISRDRSGVDPFTQVKSAERIGENLTRVIQTGDFMDKVFGLAGATFDRSRWERLSPRDKRRRWQRDVWGATVYNSSLVRLSVYSTTPEDAAGLGAAVTQALATRGWEYVGGDVAIKIVNPPLVSRFPARPNLPVNVGAGFVAGAALWGLAMSRRQRRAHLFGRK